RHARAARGDVPAGGPGLPPDRRHPHQRRRAPGVGRPRLLRIRGARRGHRGRHGRPLRGGRRRHPRVRAGGLGGHRRPAPRPGSVQTYLSFGHGVPDRSHHDWPSLTVAAHVLGGGLTSRLNAKLREEKGYTYGMRAGLLRMRHCGLFVAQGAVHTEVTADAVSDALTELRSIVSRGIDADEHGASVRALADRAPAEYETARAVAAELADASANGLGSGYPSAYLAAVRASTPDGVARAYRKHVDPEALTVIAVGDAAQIREPLEKLGYATVTVTAKEE